MSKTCKQTAVCTLAGRVEAAVLYLISPGQEPGNSGRFSMCRLEAELLLLREASVFARKVFH